MTATREFFADIRTVADPKASPLLFRAVVNAEALHAARCSWLIARDDWFESEEALLLARSGEPFPDAILDTFGDEDDFDHPSFETRADFVRSCIEYRCSFAGVPGATPHEEHLRQLREAGGAA